MVWNDTDVEEGRVGEWMHTSLGHRFYPLDPRPEEIFISDIANGLAGERRYANQGIITKHYSVAEHCVHMCRYGLRQNYSLEFQLGILLHDAAEAYICDLAKSVKASTGRGYKLLEKGLEQAIWDKYDVTQVLKHTWAEVKGIDKRMVPSEKAAVMRYPQPWAYDMYTPLPGVVIKCWKPETAKRRFLAEFERLAEELGLPEEYIEL